MADFKKIKDFCSSYAILDYIKKTFNNHLIE